VTPLWLLLLLLLLAVTAFGREQSLQTRGGDSTGPPLTYTVYTHKRACVLMTIHEVVVS